jgi:hypothetical protein
MAYFEFSLKPARHLCAAAVVVLSSVGIVSLRAQAPPAPEDELVFTNGDKLTGKLTRVAGGNVEFHSDMAGDVSIPLAKVKALHTQGKFALLKPGETEAAARKEVPAQVEISDTKLIVTPPQAAPMEVPVKDVAYLIDEATFHRELVHKPTLRDGWNGTVAFGATVVQSTQHGNTLTGGVALVRQMPTFTIFAPRNRTLINFQETYGTLTQDAQPFIGVVASTVKTSIMHAGVEYDDYFSKKFFVLGTATWDHNYAQLLQLQQIYGVGIGYTAFNTPKHELDLRADIHYEKQEFVDPTANVNLVGSSFSEAYRRSLPHKILFTEGLTLIPSWNDPSVFSLNANAGLALPVWHRLSVSMSTADAYLSNPPAGANKNSFLFVTGLTYTLR